MAQAAHSEMKSGSSLVPLIVSAGVIVALFYGRDLLIPFALAVLLTFVLAPPVAWLRRIGLPRVPSVLSVVLLAFVLFGGIGLVVGSQVVDLAEKLPEYRQNIAKKIRSLSESAPGGGIFGRAAETIRELERELHGKSGEPPQAAPPPQSPDRQARPETSTVALLGAWAVPLLSPLATAGLVVVFVVFILLGREDLRNRAIRLMGGELHATTEAMDEAARRVSRYLLMQLVINTGTSIPFGIALYLIGVPNALLWSMLAIVLRFIPYIGPLLAALFPATLAAAVDPGWGMLLWTLGVYVVMEAVTNNVIEPRLYGTSTGISEVAIIMSAIFWTALWGPVGLFLATPLTVCLAVMGRHVPQLAFLDVLLGKTPVLSPSQHFYQRMLAGDAVEGTHLAETFVKERPVVAFYDEVALPALSLAERDRQRAALAPERRAVVTETVLEVVDDLADDEEVEGDKKDEAEHENGNVLAGNILCLAARTGFDFAAASMLAQLLREGGFEARSLPAEALSLSAVASLDVTGVDVFCLCYVGFANTAHARHLLRRLRRRAHGKPAIVALWPRELQAPSVEALTDELKPARIVRSMAEALQVAGDLLRSGDNSYQQPPVPADEEERLGELHQLGVLDTPAEERFDRVTKQLAKDFGAPISLLSLVDEDRQYWKSQVGLPEDLAVACQAPRGTSICGHVVAQNEVLVIEDVLKDKRFAKNPFLRERGIRFYAGAPVRTRRGYAIGSICVIDVVPRKVGERDCQLIQSAARQVAEEIEGGSRMDTAEPGPEPAQAA